MRLDPVDINLVQACPRTGRTLSARRLKATALSYCVAETDSAAAQGSRILVIGREEKSQQEFAISGGVKVLTKLAATEGKATIILTKRNLQVMLQAEPSELMRWLRALANPAAAADYAVVSTAARPASAPAPQKRVLAPLSPNCLSPVAGARAHPKKGREPGRSPQWEAAASLVGGGAAAEGSRSARTAGLAPSPLAALTPTTKQQLTSEQQAVMRDVLSGRSVFLTGGAGVGKSFLLKYLLSKLPTATTFVTASTGIAACALGGVTIHHWAGIGGGERPIKELIEIARRKRGRQWRAATCLIIDEVSMLDGRLFDTLEAVARAVRCSDQPFGGLQLVLVGDFFQLPPVAKEGDSYRYAFEAASWASCVPKSHNLSIVFRQQDTTFIAALNAIRFGRCPPEVRQALAPCERRQLHLDEAGIMATKLCTHKAECAQINDAQIRALPEKAFTFTARDDAQDDAALALLRSSCVAPSELKLKPGAQVILLKTIDSDAGLANGARAIVLKMVGSAHHPLCRFHNGVERIVRPEAFQLSQAGLVVASRHQLPLALGWAISVHKSQGMSLDRVEMRLKNVFECGQMYVALSRARSLEGLAISAVDWSKLRAHPRVLAWHAKVEAGGS